MVVFKRHSFDSEEENLLAFDFCNGDDVADITGAIHTTLSGTDEWYFFTLCAHCDISRLDDTDYVFWLLYDEYEGQGYSCGSFSSLEELISCGDCNNYEADLLRHFL